MSQPEQAERPFQGSSAMIEAAEEGADPDRRPPGSQPGALPVELPATVRLMGLEPMIP